LNFLFPSKKKVKKREPSNESGTSRERTQDAPNLKPWQVPYPIENISYPFKEELRQKRN